MRSHASRMIVAAFLTLVMGILCAPQGFAAPHKFTKLPHWYRADGGAILPAPGETLEAVTDRLLVGVVSPRGINTASAVDMAKSAKYYATAADGRVSKMLSGGRIAVVELPAGSDLYAAATKIRAAGAAYVEPDLAVHTQLVSTDPNYIYQLHHAQINSPGAWDISTGSSSVVIAVVDSGVDLDHPDLAANIWSNTDEIPGNGVDDDGNGYIDDYRGWDVYNDNNDPNPEPDGYDNNGDGTKDDQVCHGTLVAGLAAAVGDNGFGTAGLCWHSRIMPIQIFPDDGTTTVSAVVEGIDYAVDNNADVINLSIGSSFIDSFSPPINRAYAAGICVVSAAGNETREITASSSTWRSPVCNDGPNPLTDNYVLGVGAVDQYDVRTWFTNYDTSGANFVDVSAPGQEVYGPAYYDPTYDFNSYFYTNSGTSFSAPIVSGLCGLVLSVHPEYSPAQVYQAIRETTDNIDDANPGYAGTLGTGRINAGRALGQELPPAAVTDFEANDTAGDNGGSITLTWVKSSDDGGGTTSLANYIVMRRTGTEGDFVTMATLDPGTENYDDTAVTDGTEYYYTVRSTDGEKYAETGIAGPVVSSNDSQPDAVTSLVALDKADDDGGAIQLDWSDYTPPADFASYRIYRATRDFSSTATITVIQTITEATTKTWLDTTPSDGIDYYYAVGVRDTADNENRLVRATGPVQSYPNNNITVGPGIIFIGPAAVPTDKDPATMLNVSPASLQAARWNSAAATYDSYEAGNLTSHTELALGHGFWANLPSATIIQPTGTSAPAGDFSIALTPGWHQLANPFFGPIDFGDSTVEYNSNVMDLLSAESAHIIRAFAWVYDSQAGEYVLAYPDIEGTGSLIPPWTGFWVLVDEACTLTIARPAETANVTSVSAVPVITTAASNRDVWAEGWHTRIALRANGVTDASSYIGTAASDYAIASPPPVHNAPKLYLSAAHNEGVGTVSTASAPYAVSLGAINDRSWTWDLEVRNLQPGTRAEVALPDLSELPKNCTVLLHDTMTGSDTYMRTASAYHFTARDEQVRRLQLTVQEKATGTLTVTSMSVQPAGAGGAQIVFSLSEPAQTSVEILNIAGRTVRKVEQEHLRLAGIHTILFDGRNDQAAPVPGGRYLVAVSAAAENGQQVRHVSMVNITK